MNNIRFSNTESSTAPTSRYAPRIQEKEWEVHEAVIRKLHAEGLTKKEIREHLAAQHHFYPSISQLAERCKKWDLTVYNARKPPIPTPAGQQLLFPAEAQVSEPKDYLLSFQRILGLSIRPDVYLSDLEILETKANILLSAGFCETAFELYGSLLSFIISSNLKAPTVVLGFRCILNCFRTFIEKVQVDWIFDKTLEFMSTAHSLNYPPFLRTLLVIYMHSCRHMSQHAKLCYSKFLAKYTLPSHPSKSSNGMELYCTYIGDRADGTQRLCIIGSDFDIPQLWPFQMVSVDDLVPVLAHPPSEFQFNITMKEIYPTWRWCVSCIVDFANTAYVSPLGSADLGALIVSECRCYCKLYHHLVMVATSEQPEGLEIGITMAYGKQQLNLFDSLSIVAKFLTSSRIHDASQSGTQENFMFQALLHTKAVFEAPQYRQEVWLKRAFTESLKPELSARLAQRLSWSHRCQSMFQMPSTMRHDATAPTRSVSSEKCEFDRILDLRRSPSGKRVYHSNGTAVAQIYHVLGEIERRDGLPVTPPVLVEAAEEGIGGDRATRKEQENGNEHPAIPSYTPGEYDSVMDTTENSNTLSTPGPVKMIVPYRLVTSSAETMSFGVGTSISNHPDQSALIAVQSNSMTLPTSQILLPANPTPMSTNNVWSSNTLSLPVKDTLFSPARPWSETSSLRSFWSTAQRLLAHQTGLDRNRQSSLDAMSMVSGVSTRSSWSLRKYLRESRPASSVMQVD